MVDGVHAALAKHLPLGSDALLALREMWKVDATGRLCSWLELDELDAGYADALHAGEERDTFTSHVDRMRSLRTVMLSQSSVECAALGCLSKGWRRLVKMECEMRAGPVLQLLADVQSAMRQGIRKVWLHRNKARHKWIVEHKQTIWHRRDAALDKLLQRYKQRGEDIPDGMRLHVLNMKGKRLRKWLVQHESDQRCVTEFFKRLPAPDALCAQRKRQHTRIKTAALLSRTSNPTVQLSLVGSLQTADVTSSSTLTFSRHLPAHTLPGHSGSPRTLPQVRCGLKQRQAPCSASRKMQQMQIAVTAHGRLIATPAPVLPGKKRRRGGAAAGEGDNKKQRTQGNIDPMLGARKRSEFRCTQSKPSMADKRKLDELQATAVAKGQAKRKSAAGFNTNHGAGMARCSSGDSSCDVHIAGGSLHAGGKNSAELLGNSTMRPLD